MKFFGLKLKISENIDPGKLYKSWVVVNWLYELVIFLVEALIMSLGDCNALYLTAPTRCEATSNIKFVYYFQ